MLRPGDRAYVIANLDFAAVYAGDGEKTAWPPGTMGFDHDVSEEAMAEFEAASAALLMRMGQRGLAAGLC